MIRSIVVFLTLASSLYQPSCAQVVGNDVFIISEKFNYFLYLNINNPVKIHSHQKVVSLKTDNGEVFDFNGKTFINPANLGACNIFISFEEGKEETIKFQVIQIEILPQAYISRYGGGRTTPIELNEVRSLAVYWDIDYEDQPVVKFFTLNAYKNDALIDSNFNQGRIFDSKTQKILKQYKKFDKIIFTDVVVGFKNANTMQARELVIDFKADIKDK